MSRLSLFVISVSCGFLFVSLNIFAAQAKLQKAVAQPDGTYGGYYDQNGGYGDQNLGGSYGGGAGLRLKAPIASVVPAAKGFKDVPGGFNNCSRMAAGWDTQQAVWLDARNVCQRPGRSDQVWVKDYWSCPNFKGTICNQWTWISGHYSTPQVAQ